MSANKKKTNTVPTNKIQSTIEHFAKKVKTTKKRKDKAARKAQEETKERLLQPLPEGPPEVLPQASRPIDNLNPVPPSLLQRPDFAYPGGYNELMYPPPANMFPVGGTSNQEMIANCMYYGHMYQRSLMAVKVSLSLSSL